MSAYPQVRANPLTGDRVIVAPARAERPQSERPAAGSHELPERDPDCPFCPGNELETPREILRIPESEEGDWRVRVVLNKYPVLEEDAGEEVVSVGPGRQVEAALGRHEVVIEARAHDRTFTGLADDELLDVLRAYRSRYAAAAADARIRHVVIFRNQGELANATIEHPHSQLAAMAFVPPALTGRIDRARAYLEAHGRSLLEGIVEQELGDGSRVVASSDSFVTFVPFAPTHDGELWIAPRQAPPRLDAAEDAMLLEFGRALRRAVSAMERAFDGPDYNLVVQSAPLIEGAEAALPWYGQLVPRRTLTAGFELGVGVHILVATPEETARALREAAP
ncbi:MAG: hypothetical protein GWN99_17410 [Gemmatimonadetes bacterium]|uniref:Galactose-1-phosphate uridyl transferase N-terminal domain-containing protein n=1 Tax=Candidatus Kutchimonas denitrificans TaxID=3056748 RepID=A0AAE5C8M9_9BACT|nr:hypothetical protein [Gemmatimonadota bacterium]NIR74626.1 hypothetical protein [Candidatus Kutchimonas denitrificans]NIS02816.1 hypothetical protein [Gemmatimonadota bacterium]NIT68977.1 hypothetical protein [Gemmatimonadota bacterium]NIU52282.1 hypothetical protein [Gemmatimonadota bacterium]